MQIEEYQHGRIVIDGRVENRDLIITPGGIHPDWWREQGHVLSRQDLDAVFRDPPDVLIVGTGSTGRMRPTDEVSEAAAEAGIRLEVLPTAEAVSRFNEFARQDQLTVAAAFHLTC